MLRKLVFALLFTLVLLLPGVAQAQAEPIYGVFFCQYAGTYCPQADNVHIVYLNHATKDVTDEVFGTSYDQAAIQGCSPYLKPGQTLYLVRYRQDVSGNWVAWCYTDPNNYVSIPGAQFGQSTIDAAVARAKAIVYPGYQ